MDKGRQRSKRLQALSPDPKAKIRACTQGVMSVALYGHVAMRMAPKRLKWVRQQHAIALGRMGLGSTELVLEMHIHKHADPTFTIMNQQLRLMHKLLVMWGDQPREELESSFDYWSARIKAPPLPPGRLKESTLTSQTELNYKPSATLWVDLWQSHWPCPKTTDSV